MVWVLRAVDAAIVPSTYYLKSAATYSVGRKDCYITIQTDKAISRVHANLITEEARPPQKDVHDVADIPQMPLRVHDLSKFGTFVNKIPSSKPLISVPGCEAPLNDGDVVTFGTNRTSFRVEFVPFFLCISSADRGKENPTCSYALRHGAYAVGSWKEGCTHVLVDEGSAVTEMVIAAVASSKPVVQIDWWQKFSTETAVITELLPHSSYLPTLMLQGKESAVPIKIALPAERSRALQGYMFFLGPLHLYEQGKHLVRLLEVAGATVDLISKSAPGKQAGAMQQLVVKPRDGTVKECWGSAGFTNAVAQLPRTSEEKLVMAVLAGHVDVTTLPLPASPVASADTDETREDPDAEDDSHTADTLSFRVIESTPVPSPQEARRQPSGASAHIPIDLDDDDEPVFQATRTSKRHRPDDISSGEHDGSPEASDHASGKRQKVDSQARLAETPGGSTTTHTRQSIKVTNSESFEVPLGSQQHRTATKRKLQDVGEIVGSGTLEKFFSQSQGKKAQLGQEAVDAKKGGDNGAASQGGRSPFVSSSRRAQAPPSPAPKAEDPSKLAVLSGPESSQVAQADIVYSKLVVSKGAAAAAEVPFPTTPTGSVLNFKRFKKKGLGVGVSGNTYMTLVPFAKEPYRESDLGRERNEFMQEERRRKEAENLADDLFNAERLKRQSAAKPKPRAPVKK